MTGRTRADFCIIFFMSGYVFYRYVYFGFFCTKNFHILSEVNNIFFMFVDVCHTN